MVIELIELLRTMVSKPRLIRRKRFIRVTQAKILAQPS